MAKTRKPVSLLIHPDLDGEATDKLREQGHIVDHMEDEIFCATDYDLILGPNCWWMPPEHLDMLPTALSAAREERYKDQPKPAKRKKKDDNG